MRFLGPAFVVPLLVSGCSWGLDWALPRAPGADGAAEAAQVDLGPPIEDTPDAGPELDVSTDAPTMEETGAEAGDPDAADQDVAGYDVHFDAAPDATEADIGMPHDGGVDAPGPQDSGCHCPFGDDCVNGVCTRACSPGWSRCGVVCVDQSSTLLHCGACGNACRPGHRCCAGVCEMRCS